MPNWCSNEIDVSFDTTEEYDAFKEFALTEIDGEIILDFSKIIPPPEKFSGDNPAEGWYEWRLENWGTKWSLNEMSYEEYVNGDGASMYFDTAWSPPQGIYEKLVDEFFPKMAMNWFYKEEGMQISGWLPS
jgi:hypothetical protein